MDPRPTLITGGAGFVGSALAQALLDRGESVRTFDTMAQERLEEHPSLDHIIGDVTDRDAVRAAVAGCSLVLHLAAIADVRVYMKRPEAVLDNNILGTRNVLGTCADAGAPVIFASSSEAYGRNEDDLSPGSSTVLGPTRERRWCYSVSKLAGEHYAWAMRDRGLRVAVVRYFNVYGPLLDGPGRGRVIRVFLDRIEAGEALPLVDGGHAIRSFCYVDDAVRGTLMIRDALLAGSADGEVYNVGNDEPVSMKRLAEVMIALSGHEAGTIEVSGVAHFGAGFAEIPRRVPDLSGIAELGFVAEVSLAEGVRRTLRHFDLLASAPEPVPPVPMPALRPVFHATESLMTGLGRTLRSGQVSNDGWHLREFEGAIAGWLGVDDVVACASGSAAWMMVCRLAGLRGRVAVPSYTFIATVNGLVHAGLEPVLCDIDPESWTLDPAAVRALTEQQDQRAVDAVAPVNAFGVHPDLEAFDVPILYDNAHGLGTTLEGRRVPLAPVAQAFSLHATKLLPAVEGGLLYSPDPSFRERARDLRRHGLAGDPLASGPGFNLRMDELRAQIALQNLAHLDADLARRREYADRLRDGAAALGLRVQRVAAGQVSGFQNLGVLVPNLARMQAAFAKAVVGARRYFHPPLHHMRAFGRGGLPVTDAVWGSALSLPIYSEMSEDELRRIEAALESGA